jgi:hypothetical protein
VVDASWESLLKDAPLDCQVLDSYNVCVVGHPDRRKAAEAQARPLP